MWHRYAQRALMASSCRRSHRKSSANRRSKARMPKRKEVKITHLADCPCSSSARSAHGCVSSSLSHNSQHTGPWCTAASWLYCHAGEGARTTLNPLAGSLMTKRCPSKHRGSPFRLQCNTLAQLVALPSQFHLTRCMKPEPECVRHSQAFKNDSRESSEPHMLACSKSCGCTR